jgi:hypothetical protein
MMKPWIVSFGLALALWSATARAHHSIAAVYDGSKQVTIEGVVTRFQFTNPHPIVVMEVSDAGGKRQDWRLEMDNRSELAAVGVTTETLRPGDRVVVSGSLARSQPNSLYIRRLDRPADGFQYEQVGGSPRVRAPSR